MKELTLIQADRQRNYGRDYFCIGCTPTDEDCTQAGYDYEGLKNGKIECQVLGPPVTKN